MATNITQAFIDQWSMEVKHAYQQRGPKLREAVRVVTGVTGSTHKFHTLGTVTANQKSARDADVTPLNPSQGIQTATLQDFYGPIYLDKLDEVKTNADFRREFVVTSASAIARAADQEIITNGLDAAVTAGAPSVDATAGFSVSKILELKAVLDEKDVPMEDRYLIVSPQAVQQAMNNTEVTSADYQTVKALVRGEIDTSFGFKWIMSTLLSKDGTNVRSCFALHKNAVGLAVGYDMQTEVSYIPQKANWLINTMMSCGSTYIDLDGIVELKIQEV